MDWGPTPRSRGRAALVVAPFLALGVADVVLLLLWGLDPLWGFMILPPILFISVLGWIAVRTGFVDGPARDGTGASDGDGDADSGSSSDTDVAPGPGGADRAD